MIHDIRKPASETVLVMQGGGSLGAYECGVYKALERRGIKFDVVAGTSIGAVNAGIIAGSKSGRPAKDLEDFWLHIAEAVTPPMLSDGLRSMAASTYSAVYGNARIFLPLWYSAPALNTPYLYDLSPLKATLANYIDFGRLSPGHSPRLIVTSTDIQSGEPAIFDSFHAAMTADHLAACAGFPFYGVAWTKVSGRYLWDGSLLSNTPLREVITASPKNDKRVYIVSLFPKDQEELPKNMQDSWHRARDIMYSDKTDHNIKMSRAISRYLTLLREMHDLLSNVKLDDKMKDRFLHMEREYHRLADDRGAIIEKVVKIERKEEVHFIFEDADFSISTIRKLIKQGEEDAERVLNSRPS